MKDCRLQLITDIELILLKTLPESSIEAIINKIIQKLNSYEIIDRCTDLVAQPNFNEKILKQYCACLFVDGKSEKTIYQYRRTLLKLADTINKPFNEIGVYDIRYFLACEKERGLSNRSIENTRANISAFFQWMTKEDIIPKNPCANINPIKYDDIIRKPFSDVEIDKLRSACKTKKERAIVEFLLSSGVRVSELSDMKISDIDLSNRVVHVVCGKGGKGRITYITNIAATHLKYYLEERNDTCCFVFCNKNHTKLNAGGIRHILNEITKRANVNNVHPHRFRRTFASNLAVRGMDIQEIKALLGHSNINTTLEYVYVDTSNIKTAYQKYII